ncbi:hypothetical protein NPIL_380701 [Nephila pilipes]|uniref:Uncharacterized protein n=1 Tax=Nephila pilipes TaxID=299642 RepID=A0A8X6QCY8_NEPPI|nr:hypothetical protein NPIL_380701 [Nephila pilipes]
MQVIVKKRKKNTNLTGVGKVTFYLIDDQKLRLRQLLRELTLSCKNVTLCNRDIPASFRINEWYFTLIPFWLEMRVRPCSFLVRIELDPG